MLRPSTSILARWERLTKAGRILLSALVVIAGLATDVSRAADHRKPYPRIFAEIQAEGKIFTAVLIEPHWNADPVTGEPTPSHQSMYLYGQEMVSEAESRIREVYLKAYPERAATGFFDNLWSDAPLFDPRSQIVLLYEGNSLDRLVGSLKVSWVNSVTPELPLGSLFPAHSPAPSLTYQIDERGRKIIAGGIRELKAFMIDNPRRLDLMPTLLAVAERFGIFSSLSTFLPFQDSLEGDLAVSRGGIAGRAYTSGKFAGGVLTGGWDTPLNVFAEPKNFYLACDPLMVEYYEKLGFTVIPGAISADGSLLMVAESKVVRHWFQETLSRRPGRGMLSMAQLNFTQVLAQSVGEGLVDYPTFKKAYSSSVSDLHFQCAPLLGPAEALDPVLRFPRSQ